MRVTSTHTTQESNCSETDSEEKHANGARGNVSQEAENMKGGSQTRLELTSRWRTSSRQNIKYGWARGT